TNSGSTDPAVVSTPDSRRHTPLASRIGPTRMRLHRRLGAARLSDEVWLGSRCRDSTRYRWIRANVPRMIVERSMNDDFLSNTYVVADEPDGHAVMIDAGGP